MKQKKYSTSYFATLRLEQMRLLQMSISWRQKNIKSLSKQEKKAQLFSV